MRATRTTTTTATTLTVLAALAIPIAAGCRIPLDTAPPVPAAVTPATGPAADLLAALPVAPEDTAARYDRDEWGDWTSRDGCDTRERVLADQGTGTVLGKACRPLCPATGPACWVSPYDGAATRDASRMQIDHRVPLAEATRSGAADWTREQKTRFYNDPTNLVAASVHSNTSKGDNDPAHWRPADRGVWCGYATAYIDHQNHLPPDRSTRPNTPRSPTCSPPARPVVRDEPCDTVDVARAAVLSACGTKPIRASRNLGHRAGERLDHAQPVHR